MNNAEFIDLKAKIEKQTGFKCYENSTNNQLVFYGTSRMFEAFKTLIGTEAPTGTMVYFMDTIENKMYSQFENIWY